MPEDQDPETSTSRPTHQTVDPEAVRASYARLTALFTAMMVTVGELTTHRCPYRDSTDHCTARFGCRNQRKPEVLDGPRVCGGDGDLDYRSAWETS